MPRRPSSNDTPRVLIEIRAAELALDAPRGPVHGDSRYTHDEFLGYAIHYWSQYGGKKAKMTAPEGAEQEAGWLAREIFVAED